MLPLTDSLNKPTDETLVVETAAVFQSSYLLTMWQVVLGYKLEVTFIKWMLVDSLIEYDHRWQIRSTFVVLVKIDTRPFRRLAMGFSFDQWDWKCFCRFFDTWIQKYMSLRHARWNRYYIWRNLNLKSTECVYVQAKNSAFKHRSFSLPVYNTLHRMNI